MADLYRSKQSHNNVAMRAIDNEIRDLEFDRAAEKTWATPNDVRDMDALGLNPTFKRRFQLVAMIGFSSTVVVAWQNTLATFYFALYNGGTGGEWSSRVFGPLLTSCRSLLGLHLLDIWHDLRLLDYCRVELIVSHRRRSGQIKL